MCMNVIDGKLHLHCEHFIPMATRKQDCFQKNCKFSRSHPSDCMGSNCGCTRLMMQPQRNPIRIHESLCPDCVMRGGPRRVLGCS